MQVLKTLVAVTFVSTLAAQTTAPPRPASAAPAPEQILGFKPGTDRKLADFADLTKYVKALAAASPRVKLFSIGKSTEGRDFLLAAISSEANLQRLARYKDIARQLADARSLNDDQAHALA